MPKFELGLSVKDEADHAIGKFRKKEGDIISIRPYPRNCGRGVIDEYLIVIVECASTQPVLKSMLTAPLWEGGLVYGVDFRDIVHRDDGVNIASYPGSEYVWNIKIPGIIERPGLLAKRRYKIPLNILGNIDLVKVQDKKYIYQPFKKASQLVEKFHGAGGNHYLQVKDVDCAAVGIGKEEEVAFQWSAIDNLVIDKYTDSYVAPPGAKTVKE